MTSESSEPQIASEEAAVEAQTEATLPETPALNRAERRALAQKKKPVGGASGGQGAKFLNPSSAANRPSFVGKAKIPRTGHK